MYIYVYFVVFFLVKIDLEFYWNFSGILGLGGILGGIWWNFG